jgi:hypothetical protein
MVLKLLMLLEFPPHKEVKITIKGYYSQNFPTEFELLYMWKMMGSGESAD